MPEPDITSRHNERLKKAIKLRDSRERRRSGKLLVDGSRETLRAIQSGVKPIEVFLDSSASGGRTEEAVAELVRREVPIVRVTPEPFEKIAYGNRADGLVLVAEATVPSLSEIELPRNPLVLVVEGIEKPGNLGAILRTADGAGVDAVIVTDSVVDIYNPNVIRSSVGTVFRKGLAIASSDEAVAWLLEQQIQIVAASPEAENAYYLTDLAESTAIVLGSEALGLSEAWRSQEMQLVSLPMNGIADSLNVSATAAVMLYEARRQRSS